MKTNTSEITIGSSVWVGQWPMHRQGTIAEPAPRNGWLVDGGAFVRTNLGVLFYGANDIHMAEPQKPI